MQLARWLWAKKKSHLHSLWINYNRTPGNRILGSQWQLCQGSQELWVRFGQGGCAVCLGPGSFAQANYHAYSTLLEQLSRQVCRRLRNTET